MKKHTAKTILKDSLIIFFAVLFPVFFLQLVLVYFKSSLLSKEKPILKGV